MNPVPDIYYQEREAAAYDLEYGWKTNDLDYWTGLAREYAGNGTALELACGTLRVLLPVARAGVHIVGVDHSPWMLEHARRKLEQEPPDVQARVTLREGDMRAFDLGAQFEFIYIPFNSFQILRAPHEQLAALERIRAHLAPNGRFAFELFVPDLKRIAAAGGVWRNEVNYTPPGSNVRAQRDSMVHYDTLRQVIHATFRHRRYRDGTLEGEWVSDMELGYLFPREVEHLVARAGFTIEHYWGDYDRADFWTMEEPVRQLLVLRAE